MRYALKLSWLAPLLAIACGGSTAADLFNDAARGGASGADNNGGASAQGGTVTSSGGNASGGASAQGGSSAVSGGANAHGGSTDGGGSANGGDSANGGNSVTGGSDVGGAATSGGSGTAGAGTQGGSSAGGAAAGGTGAGGTPAGGTSSQAGGTTGAGGMTSVQMCEQMRSMLSTLLTEAQRCSLALNAMQCTGFVDSECGCQVPVNNPDSPATKAYTTAVASYKSSCSFACPAIACVKPTAARCSSSGSGSQGRCVTFNGPVP